MSSSVRNFERTLSETVAGEKLSGSRVDRVRSQALQELHHADELAGVIERVHRSASSKAKVSSLYLFDAVARNAQDVIRKRASGFDYRDARPPSGSRAQAGTKDALIEAAEAFLDACSRIVEEIALSSADSVRADQKDKITKVIEIWIKAGTFDVALLERIRSKVLQNDGHNGDRHSTSGQHHRKDRTGEEVQGNSIPNPYGMAMNDDERRNGESISQQQGPNGGGSTAAPSAPPNIPSNILAMLGGSRAEEASKPATSEQPNADKPAESLDPNQLAMLQRVNAVVQKQQGQQEPRPARSDHTATSSHNEHQRLNSNASKEPPRAASNHFRADQSVGDLSHFNISAFDPTQASEWLKLAQHWHNTYQYVPTNQELMTGLMSVMQSQMFMQAQMMQPGAGIAGGDQYPGFPSGGAGFEQQGYYQG